MQESRGVRLPTLIQGRNSSSPPCSSPRAVPDSKCLAPLHGQARAPNMLSVPKQKHHVIVMVAC